MAVQSSTAVYQELIFLGCREAATPPSQPRGCIGPIEATLSVKTCPERSSAERDAASSGCHKDIFFFYSSFWFSFSNHAKKVPFR